MTTQVGPGLAKPECWQERQARRRNEVRVSEFHSGPQSYQAALRLMVWTPAPSGAHTSGATFGRFEMPTLTIGLDIAKNVFQVYGVDRSGRPVIQRKLRRADVLKFFSKLESSLIGIEACHGSHFWARELTSQGHTVRLLPTQYVKPFVVGGKNDANDASAICAAVSRPGIHPVPIKSAEQQSLQSVHRMRERSFTSEQRSQTRYGACLPKRGSSFR